MKKSSKTVSLTAVSLAILFITAGLAGITHFNSTGAEFLRNVNTALGGQNDFIPIIMSIIELAAGILIVLNILKVVSDKVMNIAIIIILIYWIIRIILNFFADGFAEPDFLIWLENLAPQLVILAAVWSVYRGRLS